MSDAFQIFALTHSVVTTPFVVHRITAEVIEDFLQDGAVYVELRTVPSTQTPRDTPQMTKREYLAAVVKAMEEAKDRLVVRLVISVNRAQGLDAAREALELTSFSPLIVGMDFSGNPSIGRFQDYEEVFSAAHARGLKTTIHTAELPDPSELAGILAFRPHRLGHCCYLDPPSEAILQAAPIPMEICLSSNIGTMELAGVSEHHFEKYFRSGYPVVVCTDDTAVFQTSLTQEYLLLVEHLGLTMEELRTLAKGAIEFVFDTSLEVRDRLMKAFEEVEKSLVSS